MMESGPQPYTEQANVSVPAVPSDAESTARVIGSGEITAPGGTEISDSIEDSAVHQRTVIPKQVHHIGGTLLRGVHPDPQVQSRVANLRRSLALHAVFDHARFAELPTVNHEYDPQITEVRQKMTDDFGEQTGNAPIKLLTSKVYDETTVPGTDAVVESGHIIARANRSDLKMYGPRPVLKSVLHEAAHLAADGEHEIVTFVRDPAAKDKTGLSSSARYSVKEVPEYGFYEPVLNDSGGMTIGGYFIEEGFAESYARRAAEQMGLGVTAVGTQLFDGSEGVRIGLADETQHLPHYDPVEERVYLPWEYSKGVHRLQESGKPHAEINPSALPAYAIDLLDQQLPGLFDTMKASRNDKEALAHVKEQINGVEPGLYDTLARLPYAAIGFQRGLIKVEQALGVVNRTVRNWPL
jgi:hypothetical protein